MTNVPSHIYLQACNLEQCEAPLDAHGEITWCSNRINDTDLEYVLSTELEALRTKYEALCTEHLERERCYKRDQREWKQLHDDTLDRHDAELKALRTKYEALRTACQALIDDRSEDPDLLDDIKALLDNQA